MTASLSHRWLVLMAALGYAVDLYDIVIFGVVRVASLQDLGLTGVAATEAGIRLINLQMLGMLLGGLFWGLLADKAGRRKSLLFAIAVYSLANLASATVESVAAYGFWRFVAGFGLAGELGAGITLIAETLPKRWRGYGTTAIAFTGLLGALVAGLVGKYLYWRHAFVIGGSLGVLIFLARWRFLPESTLYAAPAAPAAPAAITPAFLLKFVQAVLLGVPIWYASSLFVNFAPEYGKALQFSISVADVLMWQSVGLVLGSAVLGFVSEQQRSRRLALLIGVVGSLLMVALLLKADSRHSYLWCMGGLGLFQGYWGVYVTALAESYPTHQRATVSTWVPNLVRGMTIPVTLTVQALAPGWGWLLATAFVGFTVFALALLSLWRWRETYGINLDYRD